MLWKYEKEQKLQPVIKALLAAGKPKEKWRKTWIKGKYLVK